MSVPRPQQTIPGLEPLEVRWSVDAGLLSVEFRGRRHVPEHMARCWHAIRDLAAELGFDKILAIDMMDDEPFEGVEREQFIRALDVQSFAGRRWAYVARSVDRISASEATQLDAQDEGIDVRSFSSLSEATLWVRFSG